MALFLYNIRQMGSKQTVHVMIESSRGTPSAGEVEYVAWGKKERIIRALKAFGLSWGLCLVSLPLPPIHWVLVPFFFLAGPIAAFFVYAQEEIFAGGKGICPECKKQFEIAKKPVQWPISDLCNHCQAEVKIYPNSDSWPISRLIK